MQAQQNAIYLDRNVVSALVRSNGARFMTVKFTAKDGEDRVYNGRANVKKHLIQNERGRRVSRAFAEHGVVPMITSKGYKAFSLDKVKELRIRNSVIRPKQAEGVQS